MNTFPDLLAMMTKEQIKKNEFKLHQLIQMRRMLDTLHLEISVFDADTKGEKIQLESMKIRLTDLYEQYQFLVRKLDN